MKKERKKAIGYSLIILGIVVIFLKPLTGITGFSVANETLAVIQNVWFWLIGIGMVVIGIILEETRRGKESNLIPIIDPSQHSLWKSGKKMKGRPYRILDTPEGEFVCQICREPSHTGETRTHIEAYLPKTGAPYGTIVTRADGSYQVERYGPEKLRKRRPINLR